MITDIYLSIGSNLSPELNIRQSLLALERAFGQLDKSPIYHSHAVGFDGPDFLNMAVMAQTKQCVEDVSQRLYAIEDQQGRDREMAKFSSRTVDIDLLLYGDQVLSTDQITLPRSEILDSAFVLKPLADIAGELIHPVEIRTISDLLTQMQNDSPEKLEALKEVSLAC